MKQTPQKDIYVYEFDSKPYFNLTNRCCNDCAFCIRANAEGIKGNRLWLEKEPTAAEALAQLTALEEAGLSYGEAVFCGYGEPTFNLATMLEVALTLSRGKGKRVRLNTNGLGSLICGRDIVPELKGKIDVVSVSLNEATAEGYDALCKPRFSGAYEALWRFAADCKSAGIETVMTAVDVLPPEKIAVCRTRAEKAGLRFRVRHYVSDNENYR